MNLFEGDAPEARAIWKSPNRLHAGESRAGAEIKIFATATLRRKSMGLESAEPLEVSTTFFIPRSRI
jgi:hypothetical protein